MVQNKYAVNRKKSRFGFDFLIILICYQNSVMIVEKGTQMDSVFEQIPYQQNPHKYNFISKYIIRECKKCTYYKEDPKIFYLKSQELNIEGEIEPITFSPIIKLVWDNHNSLFYKAVSITISDYICFHNILIRESFILFDKEITCKSKYKWLLKESKIVSDFYEKLDKAFCHLYE